VRDPSVFSRRCRHCRGVAKHGLKRSALTREIESSNLSSPAKIQQHRHHEICDHSIPNRFRYFRNRSASFVLEFRPREALNSCRPASERDLHLRHTLRTWATWTRSKAYVSVVSLPASRVLGWRMLAGAHGTRQKTLTGSKPAAGPSNGFGNLSPIVVAITEMPAANAGGTTCNLWVPGSKSGSRSSRVR
jgi:hypothetical protein